MSMGIARVEEDVILGGRKRTGVFNITGDSSYSTGGYAVTAQQFGIRILQGILQLATNTTRVTVVYNNVSGKIEWYVNGAETSSSNVSGAVVTILAVGLDT